MAKKQSARDEKPLTESANSNEGKGIKFFRQGILYHTRNTFSFATFEPLNLIVKSLMLISKFAV